MIKNAATLDEMRHEKALWSEDVFAIHHVQYSDEEIELAKEKVIDLFHEFDGVFVERKRLRQRS